MKKLLAALTLFAMIFTSACANSTAPSDTTASSDTNAVPDITLAPETTAAPEIKEEIINVLFADGKSDYTIAFSDVSYATHANELSKFILTNYNIKLPITNVIATREGDKLITIGEVESRGITSPLKTNGDFAISVGKDVISLFASGELSYEFMFEYFCREMLSRTENGNLTLTDKDSILYSESELFGTTYVDYWKEKNGNVTKEFAEKICEEYYYDGKYGMKMAYRLYLPSNYQEDKEYPVFVYLHGAGHRGNDNVLTMDNLVVCEFWNHENIPMDECIVLIPQCPNGYQWVDWPWGNGNYNLKNVPESIAMKTVVALVGEVKSTYSTDQSRYYIYGMSMGGYGTWDLIARHPQIFAAAYPVCGGGPKDAVEILKNIPIWTIHSDDDTTVPFAASEGMIAAIKSAGGNAALKRLTGYGHGIGKVSATDSEIFEWLFSQRK